MPGSFADRVSLLDTPRAAMIAWRVIGTSEVASPRSSRTADRGATAEIKSKGRAGTWTDGVQNL